jgi:polysaccharide biosynthesis protein PslG
MRIRPLVATLVAAIALIAPATAGAAPQVGMSEQQVSMFGNKYFKQLKVKHARVVVGWDVLHNSAEHAYLDQWLAAAKAAKVRPLVSFNHSRIPGQEKKLPSVAAFKREMRAFHLAYPQVKDFVTWNEGNHISQPTFKKPARAAQYFDALTTVCRSCRIAAADVLDDKKNMESWLRKFQKKSKHREKYWGLHNYVDANRFQSFGTRRMLHAVKRGQIWFTETGGLVKRYQKKRPGVRARWVRHSLKHAAKATKYVFTLAKLSKRVTRVYVYHFQVMKGNTWDSALLDGKGKPRPSYRVVKSYVKKHR